MQAGATATAQAIVDQQAYWNQADFIETFDNTSTKFWTGDFAHVDYAGTEKIMEGQFIWAATKIYNSGFIQWNEYSGSTVYGDFDVKVDTMLISGTSGQVCSGLVFRYNGTQNYYTFEVCDSGVFRIQYYNGQWNTLMDFTSTSAINKSAWNTIRVSAKGSDYDFYINDSKVASLSNISSSSGSFALLVGIYEKQLFQIAFDNFYLIKK